MIVIDKVETNYFRSIYNGTLSNCRDLNVILGANDSGKSNLLRALNLFFNNETQLNRPFNFEEDFSHDRREEARQTQGRGFIWIKVTFRNYENWRSLPQKFAVKRQWNRYSSQPDQTLPGNPEIPASTLGKFLSKIRFHYVPAVRGQEILQHYLRLLHDALLDDASAGLADGLGDLIRSVNNTTEDLSAAIERRLGFRSTIQRPSDLRELFAALDFSTSQGPFSIPLQFRGDGIQAHHIPFILQFIATKSRNTHIWAYEEPENSLEMSRSFHLADQFANDLSRDNQIFLSTHSPAFYDLPSDKAAKWIVRMSHDGPGSHVRRLHGSDIADEEVGIAALIANRSRQLFERLDAAEQNARNLASQLSELTNPVLLVEGPTDQLIIETAWRTLFPNTAPPFEIYPADGIDNVDAYIRFAVRLGWNSNRPTFGIVDSDQKGYKLFAKWGHYEFGSSQNFRVLSHVGPIQLGHLPMPNHLISIQDQLRKSSKFSTDSRLEFSIEQMFTPKDLASALDTDKIAFRPQRRKFQASGMEFEVDLADQASDIIGQSDLIYLRKVDKSYKTIFSNWVKENARSLDFSPFEPLFESITEPLNSDPEVEAHQAQ